MTDKIFFDTSPFIYYLEKSTLYYKIMKKYIMKLYEENTKIVTSILTYEEFCVQPFRDKQEERITVFEKFLRYMNINTIEINKEIALKAAEMKRSRRKKRKKCIIQKILECFLCKVTSTLCYISESPCLSGFSFFDFLGVKSLLCFYEKGVASQSGAKEAVRLDSKSLSHIKSRHTANEIMKDAGLAYKF